MENTLVVEGYRDLAPDFGSDAGDVPAPSFFPLREPCRDALESRPPQRAGFRPLHQRLKIFFANAAQRKRRVVWKGRSEGLRKFAERAGDRRTASGGARGY